MLSPVEKPQLKEILGGAEAEEFCQECTTDDALRSKQILGSFWISDRNGVVISIAK